jgi:Ribbon-helix-helix domain
MSQGNHQVKYKPATRIDENLLGELRRISQKTGVPIVRMVEDAVRAYLLKERRREA